MRAKSVKLLGHASKGTVVFIKRKYKSNLIEHVALKANCFRTVTTLRYFDLLAESKCLSISPSMYVLSSHCLKDIRAQ